jgi:hypothetical protein
MQHYLSTFVHFRVTSITHSLSIFRFLKQNSSKCIFTAAVSALASFVQVC